MQCMIKSVVRGDSRKCDLLIHKIMGCPLSSLTRHSDNEISTNTNNTNNDDYIDRLHYEKPKMKAFCRRWSTSYSCHSCQCQKHTELNYGSGNGASGSDHFAGGDSDNINGNGTCNDNSSGSEGIRSARSSAASSSDDFCNHTLLSPLHTKEDADNAKACCTRKDTIITLGTLKQAVMKVARGNNAQTPRPLAPAFTFEETINNPDIFLERPCLNCEGYDDVSLDPNILKVIQERYGIGTSGTSSSSGGTFKSKSNAHFIDGADDDYADGFMPLDFKHSTMLVSQPQLRALLVFHKIDKFFHMLQQTCTHHDIDTIVARTKESVMHNINKSNDDIHIIIIDARWHKFFDPESIARSIRYLKSHRFTTILAVVKRNYYEKVDHVHALLHAGVNKCMIETSNGALCSEEIKQIIAWIVRLNFHMSAQQVFYAALNRSKEGILITDNTLKMQYINRTGERMLNMRFQETLRNKLVEEIFVSDIASIKQLCQSQSLRECEAKLIIKRKNTEGMAVQVRVLPVVYIGKQPTHYIFELDALCQDGYGSSSSKSVCYTSSCGNRSYNFQRRSTVSDNVRHTSVAKLATSDSPVIKAVNVLTQVQQHCKKEDSALIDRVVKILKREGLFTSHMKGLQTEDPTTKDLIGALLAGPNVPPGLRASSDSILRPHQTFSTPRIAYASSAKAAEIRPIMDLLVESLSWDFDIFRFEEITEKRPLLYLGLDMFRRFGVFATLKVDESICRNWLATIESHYHVENTYHNSTHAADVMQATGVFLTQFSAKDLVLDRIQEASALIAAAAHDVDHPGRSSAFLCNSDNPLAILYNDLTVLESHHAALTFKLTLSDEKLNIFKNLDKKLYKTIRAIIVDMILATEMTKHFEHLAKFVSVFGTDFEPKEMEHTEEESSILVRRMLIKVADVSNPVRPIPFCVEWGRRIAEEYFMQTDEEKSKNLPIVMPMFDRNTCSIPKSQIGFIEYIIRDMMHAWDSFVEMPELVTYLHANYDLWKAFEEQGVRTLADIKEKQLTLKCKKKTTK